MRLIDFSTHTQPEPGRAVECNAYSYAAASRLAGTVRLDLIEDTGVTGTALSPEQARALAHQLLRCALLAEIELEVRVPRLNDLPPMPGCAPGVFVPTAPNLHAA